MPGVDFEEETFRLGRDTFDVGRASTPTVKRSLNAASRWEGAYIMTQRDSAYLNAGAVNRYCGQEKLVSTT